MTPLALMTPDAGPLTIPDALSATEPPEARALARDEVRLLVAEPAGISHILFRDIGRVLRPGDLLVVNTSATVPAALDGVRADGRRVVVHVAGALDDGTAIVELRAPDASGPMRDVARGETVALAGGARASLIGPHAPGAWSRLWRAHVDAPVRALLDSWGRPITYAYVRGRWPLDAYQTVFAREPGSAEMPSAARPFSERLVAELVARGVVFAPVVLHTGVSSMEHGERPAPERFQVSSHTAALVNHVRRAGGRVIGVGTTVARALETVARDDGTVEAGAGWTDLVLGPERGVRVLDGLISGWHTPGTSHMQLLDAAAGGALVRTAYEAALEAGYLWHEFGDSCVFLP